MARKVKSIPTLRCPNCRADILAAGFYNSCTETVKLREDNFLYVAKDAIYVDHDEQEQYRTNHQCDIDARCAGCHKLLPWTLLQIRKLNCSSTFEARKIVAALKRQLRAGRTRLPRS